MLLSRMKENYFVLISGVAGLIIGAGSFFLLQSINIEDEKEEEWDFFLTEQETEEQTKNYTEEITQIMVDIKGEVRSPGVYLMNVGDRVVDVIERAGGLTDSANENFINLAEKTYDEMVIYIPSHLDEDSDIVQVAKKDDGKVRINQASVLDLTSLPGIGPAKAEAIVRYREETGDFKTADDLVNVPGIGQKTLEVIKEYISVP